MEQNHFSIFGKESPKKHFCEMILNSGHWSRRRCHLKFFFFVFLLPRRSIVRWEENNNSALFDYDRLVNMTDGPTDLCQGKVPFFICERGE